MLANLCPSDERILLLLEHWSQSGTDYYFFNPGNAVINIFYVQCSWIFKQNLIFCVLIAERNLKDSLKLNFMFLDYPSNGENLLAWQLLLNFLGQVKLRYVIVRYITESFSFKIIQNILSFSILLQLLILLFWIHSMLS